MRVLVACEYSGTVRDAFLRHGHYAISCDILPSESDYGAHYRGDVRDIIGDGWDLMIAHPPCTYLSVAGNRWLSVPGRQQLRDDALEFFKELYYASIPRICIENPVGYANTHFRKPDQIIHPYYFGDPQMKRTCLWLKNLPLLVPTNMLPKPEPLYVTEGSGHRRYFTDGLCSGKDRQKLRSKTFEGIAEAMAAQWGRL